ncbi:MAG TPA: non-homologous end-joining DNA ligase [Steroidobacteraceae bacterium]|nr:non-homologous end-joining DNA ligase [Steroidobacteraceae bacterium]
MLATLIDAPFDDRDWVFETKWDGFRIIAKAERGKVVLLSRNGKHVTGNYPRIAAALAKVRRSAVLDGELVALDKHGRSSFQLLQNARRTNARLHYYVFDLLTLNGKDVRALPLLERKRLLRSVLPKSALISFSRHVKRAGIRAFRAAQRRGLEGIMAKRAQSRYYSGKRTREWLKIKTAKRQEVVIAGFTRPRRSRKHFGALVLALRQGRAWRYVGHTGTGFNASSLKSIHTRLRSLVRRTKPFRQSIPNERTTTWVKPKLVCEVKFTEWTKDGHMRHPAFVGMRSDKPAKNVVREREKKFRR